MATVSYPKYPGGRAAGAEYVEALDGIHDGDSVVVDGNLIIDIAIQTAP